MKMHHEFKKIVSVEVIAHGILHLEFSCGTRRKVDLTPVMFGALFGQLQRPDIFNQVRIDHEVGTICWPNGADFDPDTLFHWDEAVRGISKKLQSA
jgi:hypothetical protein